MLAGGDRVEVFAAGDGPATTHQREGRLTITRIGGGARPAGGDRLFYSDGDGAPETLERGGAAIWWQALGFWSALGAAVRARIEHLDALEAHWLVPCAAVAMLVAPHKSLRAYAHSGDVALLERLPAGDAVARFLARAASRADLIFVTAALRARFAARAGVAAAAAGRVAQLQPPVDLFPAITEGSRCAARRELGIVGPTVIAVGRLVPIKGFEHLIRACAEIPRVGDSAAGPLNLIIVGDGPERARLQAAAGGAGVRLTLPGWVPRAQVSRWLHAADVYAQPSRSLASGRSEGMPVATLEALAVGLPVVATEQAGLRELTNRHPSVHLVAPDDHAALAEALAGDLSRFCVGSVTAV